LNAINELLINLSKEPATKEIFGDKISIFDLGFADGSASSNIIKNLINCGPNYKNISYGGIEMEKRVIDTAIRRINSLGVPVANINLTEGQLGASEYNGKEKLDIKVNKKIEKYRFEKSADIFIAHNVYDFNNFDLLLNQMKKIMKPYSIAIFTQTTGDAYTAKFKDTLDKSGLANKSISLSHHHRHFKYKSKELTGADWQALATKIKSTEFDKKYENSAPDGSNKSYRKEFKDKRAKIEFLLHRPLADLKQNTLGKIESLLRKNIEDENGRIQPIADIHVVIQEGHNKDSALYKAVEAAVQKTEKTMNLWTDLIAQYDNKPKTSAIKTLIR